MEVVIRQIRDEDAPVFLDLCRALDRETTFMMLEPDERTTTPDEQRAQLRALLASGNSTVIVAEVDGVLAGYAGAYGGEFRRNRHSASVVAGVRLAFAGQGVGTRLFAALEDWARSVGVSRLELTVMAHNIAGRRLYEKMGFVVEGIRRRSLLVDGESVDELAMARILDV